MIHPNQFMALWGVKLTLKHHSFFLLALKHFFPRNISIIVLESMPNNLASHSLLTVKDASCASQYLIPTKG